MPNTDGTMTCYEYRRTQQQCVRCGVRDAHTMSGRVLCEKCNEKARKKYRNSSEEKLAHMKECREMRRIRLKEAGLCVRCGKRPASHGVTSCDLCAAKANAYYKKWKKAFKARKSCEMKEDEHAKC